MKVFWTESSLSQLQAIHDYIAQTSPEYALRMVDRITRRSIQIAEFPFSGRMVSEYAVDEIREVLEVPYRIIYLIDSGHSRVEVLAVIHLSRKHFEPLG